MKKLAYLLVVILFLCGCSTYRFSRGKAPYDKGYVAYRDDYMIPEYTVGKDNAAPGIKLAKERFKRRRGKVEYYYKKMGYIDNYFKITFWGPITSVVRVAGGVFLLPYIIISDYRYEHNPQYRQRVIRKEEEKDAFEEARINKIKAKLHKYIENDLTREEGKPIAKEKTVAEEKPALEEKKAEELPKEEVRPPKEEKPAEPAEVKEQPVKIEKKPRAIKKKEAPKAVKEKLRKPVAEKARPKRIKEERVAQDKPVAVIVAKPVRGLSPLRVRFYGNKSRSPKGRIVSYHWDFGDTDSSTKINPTNTYWSGTFLPQEFKVTLTVQDDKGNTAEDSVVIEVANR